MNEDWINKARVALSPVFTGYLTEITGQQLRAKLAAEVGEPPTPHVFGPFVGTLVRQDLIRRTGKRVPMTGKQNHGRLTPVYLI